LPELAATWGGAHPPCPNHRHPAQPALLHNAAWWICPIYGTPIAPVGAYRDIGPIR
jgi:hypothetical protein